MEVRLSGKDVERLSKLPLHIASAVETELNRQAQDPLANGNQPAVPFVPLPYFSFDFRLEGQRWHVRAHFRRTNDNTVFIDGLVVQQLSGRANDE